MKTERDIMKKEYMTFNIEVDTTEDDIYVRVTHNNMTEDELDNSYEYVNTFDEVFKVIELKIRECF